MTAASEAPAITEVLTVGVGGMSCNNCARSVTKHVTAIEGVVEARVSFALEDARIRFDPQRVTPARVFEAIADAGYSVRPEHAEAREADERNDLESKRLRMIVGLAASAAIMFLTLPVTISISKGEATDLSKQIAGIFAKFDQGSGQ